jgi:hypothetical protein
VVMDKLKVAMGVVLAVVVADIHLVVLVDL